MLYKFCVDVYSSYYYFYYYYIMVWSVCGNMLHFPNVAIHLGLISPKAAFVVSSDANLSQDVYSFFFGDKGLCLSHLYLKVILVHICTIHVHYVLS